MGDVPSNKGCQEPSHVGWAVGDAHQNTSQGRRKVEVVDFESGVDASVEPDAQSQKSNSHCGIAAGVGGAQHGQRRPKLTWREQTDEFLIFDHKINFITLTETGLLKLNIHN